jgi:hypothetical protein
MLETKKTTNKCDQTLTQMGYVVKRPSPQPSQNSPGDCRSASDEEEVVVLSPPEVTPSPKKRAKFKSGSEEERKQEKEEQEEEEEEQYKNRDDITFHLLAHHASIEDVDGQDQVHPVFGYTKHWFEKDYIVLKLKQVYFRLRWWRRVNEDIMLNLSEEMHQDQIDSYNKTVVNEVMQIRDNIKVYNDNVVLNVLNREALAQVLKKKDKNDSIVHFMYNLIHSKKISIYKAEWYVGFKTVTVFERYDEDEPCGEVSLDSGGTFEWRKYEYQ